MSLVYFAYGSNLDPTQLASRCPGARWLGKAALRDHKLAFSRFSPLRRCGVADVQPEPNGVVWGCCFALNREHLATLDRIEGFVTGVDAYERIPVTVELWSVDGSQKDVRAQTYRVRTPRPFVPPSEAYLSHLIDGACHWRLPPEWIESLRAVDAVP